MPIPVYHALTIEQPAMLGGSTLPSLMTVADGNGNIVGSYVVKVFKQKSVEQYQPTNKELYCHVLANAFGLCVPDAALVYVNPNLIESMKESAKYGDDLQEGHYFGSLYIPNVSLFQGMKKHDWLENAENIFAFDVFIRNMDRNIGKPNLLVHERELILIDHELALDIQNSFAKYLAWNGWHVLAEDSKRKHILLEHLRKANRKNALQFHEFLEYLYRLNLAPLYECERQLSATGNNTDDFSSIVAYLNEIKRTPIAFQNLLKSLISNES